MAPRIADLCEEINTPFRSCGEEQQQQQQQQQGVHFGILVLLGVGSVPLQRALDGHGDLGGDGQVGGHGVEAKLVRDVLHFVVLALGAGPLVGALHLAGVLLQGGLLHHGDAVVGLEVVQVAAGLVHVEGHVDDLGAALLGHGVGLDHAALGHGVVPLVVLLVALPGSSGHHGQLPHLLGNELGSSRGRGHQGEDEEDLHGDCWCLL
ncbi:Syncytin-2 [Frankliniella fusca]|uniref:Syncytin-2 n=1 Tax=Frankliniella fusca TaxID=407009 RepID=A0AAE1GT12_9NEOP|nr:Syncytin-2 [Frankliniella fusca]